MPIFFGSIFFRRINKIKKEYEPNSFNDYDFLKKQNLVTLIRVIASNLHCNWEALPWAEKNYGMAKQIFTRKFCETGHSADLAFEFIYQIKLHICSDEVEVDEIIDLELLKKIDPDYMIID